MKANELIKKFKEMGFAVYEDESSIEIRKGFMSFTYGKYIDPSSDTAQLFTLLDKYYQTPVKERFPEKKYRLVVKREIPFHPKYVSNIITGFDELVFDLSEDEKEARIFSEEELNQIKGREPSLAPSIDAMKEPLGNKDEN